MTATPPREPVPNERLALAAGLVLVVALSQLAWMSRTNFTGFDEWVIVDLVSRGIIDVPHGNRPFHLLWLMPIRLWPDSLTPYVLMHGIFRVLSGLLTFRIARRVAPERGELAILSALLVVVWGPGDLARLSTIERVGYSSFLFAMLLAIALYVESWARERPLLLALGGLVAFLTARGYEAVLPLLVGAPLLLLAVAGPRRRFWTWTALWALPVGAAGLLVALPALRPSGQTWYQMQLLGFDPAPLHVLKRLLIQYAFHFAPLVISSPLELLVPAVPLAVVVFAAGLWLWRRSAPAPPESADEARFLGLGILGGLLWAGLGYGVLLLMPGEPSGLRMQFLSAPGVAFCLACLASLLARLAPRRWRRLVVTLATAWVVAVGTGRTVAMQQRWDGLSSYEPQMRTLRSLVQAIPDVKDGTAVILLDRARAWRATYGFRHALRYLYEGRALGYVPGTWSVLYPTALTEAGVHTEPWELLRRPWQVAVTTTPYDRVLVVRAAPDGAVEVLPQWPAELPPLPAGARYDPGPLIVRDGPAIPERSILR